MRLFVTEKPSLLTIILETLGKQGDYVILNNSYKYKFDFNCYQQFSKPKYKFDYNYFCFKMNQYTEDKKIIVKGDILPDSFVSDYDINKITEILIITDPDHSGIRSSDLTLDIFNKKFLNSIPVNFMKIKFHSEEEIKKAYLKRTNYFKNSSVLKFRKIYQLKDYLDYNFTGMNKNNKYSYLTRNMFWLLLMLKDSTEPLHEYEVHIKMHDYNIGSIASVGAIYQKMLEENFINSNGLVTQRGFDLIQNFNFNYNTFTNFKKNNDLVHSDVSFEQGKIKIEYFLKKLFGL